MTTKEELHLLLDQLSDEEAGRVRSFVLEIIDEHGMARDSQPRRHGVVVSSREFFSAPPKDWRTLAREQGVKPIQDFDELRADFWPEEESVDEFIETIRRWRDEGG